MTVKASQTASNRQRMPEPLLPDRLRGPIRLRTLTTLRWLAAAGQTVAILLVQFGLGFEVPLGFCLAVIASSVWLNLYAQLKFSPQRILGEDETALYTTFDIAQLCVLLFLTGGLQNPFAVLILAPVTIAASVLPLRQTLIIGGVAIAGILVLALVHHPLPWRSGERIAIPAVYNAGVWAALSFSVVFFGSYAHRIAAESARMRSALAATQLVLSREERLSALGGLAAAAAHELGTPLSTIQLTAQEMADELKEGVPTDHSLLRDDAQLLVTQALRCRDILGRLSRLDEPGDAGHDHIRLDALLKEAAAPFLAQTSRPEIVFDVGYDTKLSAPPTLLRKPEIIYGLRNFIENAVRYARSQVLITARWEEDEMSVTIRDDGPGFSQDIMARLGEPYINPNASTTRRFYKNISLDPAGHQGMGLGFFIAKTLLEHTGATIEFDNLESGFSAPPAGAVSYTHLTLPTIYSV